LWARESGTEQGNYNGGKGARWGTTVIRRRQATPSHKFVVSNGSIGYDTAIFGEVPMSDLVKHILMATDGSDGAAAAFGQAVGLALHHRARLTLLHVAQHGPATSGRSDDVNDLRRQLAGRLDEFEATAREAGVKRLHLLTSSGLAYSRILQCAESEDVDLIVLGAVGAGNSSGIGEVAMHVSKFAKCSVMIIR